MDDMLRLGPAAKLLGVHAQTLRTWADSGRIDCVWVGRERRFRRSAVLAVLGGADTSLNAGPRREALYVRVSGSSGQETSLLAQETELRGSAAGTIVAVFKDRSSGLRENRPGLERLLKRATHGDFDVVRVTHEDRLARFGAGWLTALLARDAVTVEVLHRKGGAGGMEELLADFMSLVATFSGRLYGIRSRDAKARLLARAAEQNETVPASGTVHDPNPPGSDT